MHINRFADEPDPGEPLHRADVSFPTMLDRQRFSGNGRRISAEARAETMQPDYFSAPVQARSLNRSLGPSTCGIDSKSTATVSAALFLSETPEKGMDLDFQPGLCFSSLCLPDKVIYEVSSVPEIDLYRCMRNEYEARASIFEFIVREGNILKTLCDVIRAIPSLPFYVISK